MNRKNDGILSRDVYAQARRHLKGMDKATRPLWQNQGFCLFVTMLLAVMDGINLFSVYDTILYESQAMLWAMTATTAFCLEFFPMLLAVLLRQMEGKNREERQKYLIFVWAVCVGFLLVFLTTAALRWVSKDITFAGETSVITGGAFHHFSGGRYNQSRGNCSDSFAHGFASDYLNCSGNTQLPQFCSKRKTRIPEKYS